MIAWIKFCHRIKKLLSWTYFEDDVIVVEVKYFTKHLSHNIRRAVVWYRYFS